MYLFFSIFLFAVLTALLLLRRRKKKVLKKVFSMPAEEKSRLLNDRIRPLGYQYLPRCDVFSSTCDAWQKNFGYTRSYDLAAPYFHMVLDWEPVYFTYQNKTWLIEFWKGQYGITTGAEIGIYRADSILSPSERRRALFHAATDQELPVFSMKLCRTDGKSREILLDLSMKHWWLTGFRMGLFSEPEQLSADICIKFPNRDMLYGFVQGLADLGYDMSSLDLCGLRVCFTFQKPFTSIRLPWFTKIICRIAQMENKFFCKRYLSLTRPFCSTADRLLCLYFYLPFLFRRCLRFRNRQRGSRRKRREGAL